MCDIWKATGRSQLSPEEIRSWSAEWRRLGVRRVVLSGGEPLMHPRFAALCEALREAGIGITLLSTGLLLAPRAADVAGLARRRHRQPRRPERRPRRDPPRATRLRPPRRRGEGAEGRRSFASGLRALHRAAGERAPPSRDGRGGAGDRAGRHQLPRRRRRAGRVRPGRFVGRRRRLVRGGRARGPPLPRRGARRPRARLRRGARERLHRRVGRAAAGPHPRALRGARRPGRLRAPHLQRPLGLRRHRSRRDRAALLLPPTRSGTSGRTGASRPS